MADKQVADLTLEELKGLIAQVVDQRLQYELQPQPSSTKRSLQEIMDSVDSHRWTPPAGSPSVVEMIREDRDR